MTWNLRGTTAREGDLAELVGLKHKHFIVSLKQDGELHTHRGILRHNDLIGKAWGSQVFSHNGSPFFLLQPALADLLRSLPRVTQILYPKDIGFILVTMGVGEGMHILEAGTGSGSLTSAFAYAVGKEGHVTSYEVRPEMQEMAVKNITRLGLQDRVTFKLGDIGNGFDETGVDAIFLDLPNPYDYILKVKSALKMGGFFGCILPTTNQVTILLRELRRSQFAFIEVCELVLRYYKAEPDRFRPTDRMVAHTGFLLFARPIVMADENAVSNELMQEAGIPEIDIEDGVEE
ncbi:MAG TPA: tRNA (adenine-N1)-methyltransferase [Anaerolineaceae bacterium]|nr:tRNA (adenine-N1)-methyltransferase [Anaerolineaceae bacterium]